LKNTFNPRLTGRGWRIAISSLALILLGSFFRDVLILSIATTLIIFTLIQIVNLRASWIKTADTKVEPTQVEAKLVASETLNTVIKIHSQAAIFQLSQPPEGYGLKPQTIEPGDTEVNLSYKSTYFGEYKLNHLEATLNDRYELLEAKMDIPLSLKISVYPRTTQAVAEAARFLAGEDIYSLGDEPTRFRGSGFEYADSRTYVRGDSLRRLDWKATARLNKLMVKDYYIEGGIGVQIIFDGRSPDPISHDELTEALVRSALSFARRGLALDLTTIGAEGVRDYTKLQPFDAVAVALKIAFEENHSAAEPAYELLDPQSSGRVRRILQSMNLPIVTNTHLDTQRFRALEEESKNLVIYISSLQGDPLELLNLANILKAKDWDLEVLQPTRPWLHTQTLEESKRQSDYYEKLYRALDREKIKVEINAKANDI
jgi:uncharacterized protein (DUF58 family)